MNLFFTLVWIINSLANISVDELKKRQSTTAASACLIGGIGGTWIGLTFATVDVFANWRDYFGLLVFCNPGLALIIGSFIAGLGILIKKPGGRISFLLFLLTFGVGMGAGFLAAQILILPFF